MNKKNELQTLTVEDSQPMQECHYCNIWYSPTRRFVQKYCSESCRVMACRERKGHGLVIEGGTSFSKRNTTTNTELKNKIVEMMQKLEHQQEIYKMDRDKEIKTRELDFKEIRLQLKEDMQRIIVKQNWQIFLNIAIPFIAPVLSSWAAGLFKQTENKPLDSATFLKKLYDEFGDKITPEMQEQILKTMGDIFK